MERVARGSDSGFEIKPKMLDGNFVIVDCGEEFFNLFGDGLADDAPWLRSGTYHTGISHVTSIEEEGTLTGEHVGIDICDTSFFRGFVCFYHVAVYFSALRIDLVVQFDTSGAGLCAYHAARLHIATHYDLLDPLLGRTAPEFA